MYDLLELNTLVYIECPTARQKQRIEELRNKLFPEERKKKIGRYKCKTIDQYGNEINYSSMSDLIKTGVNIGTIRAYANTGEIVKRGNCKGMMIFTEEKR